jgi:hypothetical protein
VNLRNVFFEHSASYFSFYFLDAEEAISVKALPNFTFLFLNALDFATIALIVSLKIFALSNFCVS